MIVVALPSCTKDKTKQVSAVCNNVNASINTYNLKVKAILDVKCGYSGCHNAATAANNVALDSYSASKAAFQNRNALCTIMQTGSCLAMPQGQPKLADSLITYLQCWSENEYAQ